MPSISAYLYRLLGFSHSIQRPIALVMTVIMGETLIFIVAGLKTGWSSPQVLGLNSRMGLIFADLYILWSYLELSQSVPLSYVGTYGVSSHLHGGKTLKLNTTIVSKGVP